MRRFISLYFVCLVLTILIFASSWTLFNPQMFFTHDFVHGARITEMTQALQDGHFPVRWSANFGYGYGMPLFEFYAPFPYYVGSILFILGLPLVVASKMLFLLPNVGTILGSYLLGKRIFGKAGGLLVATIITLAPYRAVNLFIRGAVGETWGIMAVVWVLYTTLLVLKGEKRSWMYLVVSLVVLFLSHNLVTMISLPFVGLSTLVFLVFQYWGKMSGKSREIWRKLSQIGGSYLLSFGIASFYLLPTLMEKDLTIVEQKTTGGYFDYNLHFLYIRQFFRSAWGYGGSEWGPDDKISFFLGFGQYFALALVVVSAVYFYMTIRKTKTFSVEVKKLFLLGSFLFCLGVALFMTIAKSHLVWDSIPLFKYIQFPWRYYSVAIIFLGLLAGMITQFLPKKYSSIAVVSIILMSLFNATYFRPERFLETPEDLYYADTSRIQKNMSGILPDYIPKSLIKTETPPIGLVTCENETVVCDQTLISINRVHEKLISIKTPQEKDIALQIAYFPGWVIELDGRPADHFVTQRGTIGVHVPVGEHSIGAKFTNSPIRQISDTISVVAGSVFLFLLFLSKGTQKSSYVR